jgi:hypothetical protein
MMQMTSSSKWTEWSSDFHIFLLDGPVPAIDNGASPRTPRGQGFTGLKKMDSFPCLNIIGSMKTRKKLGNVSDNEAASPKVLLENVIETSKTLQSQKRSKGTSNYE